MSGQIYGVACVDADQLYAYDDGEGKGKHLPWPKEDGDLPWFKVLTDGHILVVGDKTFQTFKDFPPLKNREVWPVGRNHELKTVEDVLNKFKEEGSGRNLFIGGGIKLWKDFVPHYRGLYVTHLKKSYSATMQGKRFILPGGWVMEPIFGNSKFTVFYYH